MTRYDLKIVHTTDSAIATEAQGVVFIRSLEPDGYIKPHDWSNLLLAFKLPKFPDWCYEEPIEGLHIYALRKGDPNHDGQTRTFDWTEIPVLLRNVVTHRMWRAFPLGESA